MNKRGVRLDQHIDCLTCYQTIKKGSCISFGTTTANYESIVFAIHID